IWAILATFTCYFGGIILALLINKKGLKGKKIFRTVFILTIAVPQFISLLAVRNILGEYGPFNQMLKNMGLITESIGFLGLRTGDSEILAKVMVIIVNMWVGIPYTMLMTSGILMNIPTDLYEAARVDGASTVKMFFKITLPYVIFITTPYLISSFVGNINSFNTIFLLTGGGPTYTGYQAGGTDLLVTWLYKVTIDQGSYNTGAVIGIFTFLITATITLITYRRSKAYNEEDTFQ
ncbi:MAG: ABC transporter permease subunit, partial [Lachnospiraceae bacterium]|nr:ABC transporter permease subunit [Lachnospiraceae bacterium]